MLLIFLLATPLVAAVMSWLSRKRPAMEAINLAGFAVTFVVALLLGGQVLRQGPVFLWDGFLYADHLSALVILLTASMALVCSVYGVGYIREDERSGALTAEGNGATVSSKLRKYYTLTPIFVFAMLLVTVSNNLGAVSYTHLTLPTKRIV